MSDETFKPKIVAFLCNWCSYTASDLAGTARIKYSPRVRIIRVMCSGRVDPSFVLKAFALGADGVLVAGCHPGDCHYIEQNYKTMRRDVMLRYFLEQMGIEPGRLRLVWASAAEGQYLAESINTFVADVRTLGPLNWSDVLHDGVRREEAFEEIAAEHAEAMEVQP
ncbi:MAG: hydrogenase iron-sulfur subunit [Pirellulales bacterium]|nr:hydrogenase iron-sulfur subunit [Pirellulales bacterium]